MADDKSDAVNNDPATGQFDFSVKIPDGEVRESKVRKQYGLLAILTPRLLWDRW